MSEREVILGVEKGKMQSLAMFRIREKGNQVAFHLLYLLIRSGLNSNRSRGSH